MMNTYIIFYDISLKAFYCFNLIINMKRRKNAPHIRTIIREHFPASIWCAQLVASGTQCGGRAINQRAVMTSINHAVLETHRGGAGFTCSYLLFGTLPNVRDTLCGHNTLPYLITKRYFNHEPTMCE